MGSLYILDKGQKNMSCQAFLMATLGFLGLRSMLGSTALVLGECSFLRLSLLLQ